MSLSGGYYTESFYYVRIRLYPCTNNDHFECASDEEIRDFFGNQKFEFFYTNTYYDINSYPENHQVSLYLES